MAYAQWIQVEMQPIGFQKTLHVGNASLSNGKFYSGTKGNSISAGAVDKLVIANNAAGSVSSCGRESASMGTEGSIDIFDGTAQANNSNRVCTFWWTCPWGSKTNSWQISNQNNNYVIQSSGGSRSSGAIGTLTLKLVGI